MFKIYFKKHTNLHLGVKGKKNSESWLNVKFLYKCYTVEKNIGMCRQKPQEQSSLRFFDVLLNKKNFVLDRSFLIINVTQIFN